VDFFRNYGYDMLHIKGKENLVIYASSWMQHIDEISQDQTNLRIWIKMQSKEDKWYQEVFQEILRRENWIEKKLMKYDDYHLVEYGVLL
jgi:hypothetical protein